MTRWLLVHPPLLGPAVWSGCATELRAAGDEVTVLDFRTTVQEPEGWFHRAAALATPADVVVAHSGAGLLLPLVADRSGATAAVFVDALLPGRPTSDRFRDFLDQLPRTDGLLPRWTDWWGQDALAEILPDPAVRAAIVADTSRLPLSFYDVTVPVPPSWPPATVGYLRLSEGYDEDAAGARALGWPVLELQGTHLSLVTEPTAVAAALRSLAT